MILRNDMKFVERTFPDSRNKSFPNARRTARLQGMRATIPIIEISDHRYSARIRRPHTERSSAITVKRRQMRAQLVVSAIVSALIEKIEIVRRKKADIVTN